MYVDQYYNEMQWSKNDLSEVYGEESTSYYTMS